MKSGNNIKKSKIMTQIAGLLVIISLVIVFVISCDLGNPTGNTTTSTTPGTTTTTVQFSVSSTSFTDGGVIAEKYCHPTFNGHSGQNISPQLSWSGAPAGTVSFTLIVDDPTGGNWSHWILYNIPDSTTDLPEDHADNVGGSDRQGMVDGGIMGYEGPYPPSGIHNYYFRLYALDTTLDITPLSSATRSAVISAMSGHILGSDEIFGTHAAH